MPIDRNGSREIQCMMHVEVKREGEEFRFSQVDTLSTMNQFFGRKFKKVAGNLVFHWGVGILRLSGRTPETSNVIRWAPLPKSHVTDEARLHYRNIDVET